MDRFLICLLEFIIFLHKLMSDFVLIHVFSLFSELRLMDKDGKCSYPILGHFGGNVIEQQFNDYYFFQGHLKHSVPQSTLIYSVSLLSCRVNVQCKWIPSYLP